MNIISKCKYAKISSKKLISIVKLINKKKNISDIIDMLYFLNTKPSLLIMKVLKSSLNNAKNNFNLNIKNLKIKNIIINKGPFTKKPFPRAKGKIDYIKKKTSHITVLISKN